MKEKSRRRNYFIDKTFQTKFMIKFCIIVVISSLLVIGLLLFLSKDSTTVAIENTKVIVKGTADFILPMVIQTVLFVLLFSAVSVLILTMVVSHRIAGPLFRLKREIDILKEGDFRRNFNIRGDDQLQKLAKSLDEMCIFLRGRHSNLKKNYQELKLFLESKSYSLSDEDKREIIKILQAIEEGLSEFKV